jgi:hypothetical protein
LAGGEGKVASKIAAALVAVAFGAIVAVKPLSALVLIAVVAGGIVYFALSADWFSAGSLIFVTLLAVLVPINATEGLFVFGPLSGLASLALMYLILATLSASKAGPTVFARVGKITMLVSVFLVIFVAFSLINGVPLVPLLSEFSIFASAFLLAVCTPGKLVPVVISTWIALAYAEAAYAIYEFLTKPAPLYEGYLIVGYKNMLIPGMETLIRARATFGHPIPLASFLIVACVLSLFGVRFPTGRHLGIMRALAVGTIVAGIVVTFTRSSWLALAVAVCVGLISRRISVLSKLGFVTSFVVAVVILLQTPLGQNIVDYVANLANTTSYGQRMASIRSVSSFFSTGLRNVVFGVGVGSQQNLYSLVSLQSVGGLQVVDNQYITLLIEVGLLGLGTFLAIASKALSFVWKTVSTTPDPENARMVWGIGVALLAALIAIFFYDGLSWPSTAILVWSMLGFLARHEQDAAFYPIPEHEANPPQVLTEY